MERSVRKGASFLMIVSLLLRSCCRDSVQNVLPCYNPSFPACLFFCGFHGIWMCGNAFKAFSGVLFDPYSLELFGLRCLITLHIIAVSF